MKKLLKKEKNNIKKYLDELKKEYNVITIKEQIFCLLFYKFLSEKEVKWLEEELDKEEWDLFEFHKSQKIVNKVQNELGYVIKPDDLFFNWKRKINEGNFNIHVLNDSIAHFYELLSDKARNNFEGIFDEVLGMSFNKQIDVQTIIDLINILSTPDFNMVVEKNEILYIFDYLIEYFSSINASEMNLNYTPREVSEVIAQILVYDLKEKKSYSVYDPTVGSASSLLAVGECMETKKEDVEIQYFGQEINNFSYNLARMNLIINKIEYKNFNINHANTLEEDWPLEKNRSEKLPLKFDAIIANPPYSISWKNNQRESDTRWKEYGLPPKSKADYAFLLHSLYHLDENGRMAIVLPHGILFRGSQEKNIRQTLIEKFQIEAIVGLPVNLFYNTAIPLCLLFLKKKRKQSDILFIDASKEFTRIKNKNYLSKVEINKIVDTVTKKKEIESYSKVVTLDTIRENNYNLNISNYIDPYGVLKIIEEENFEYINQLEGRKKYIEAIFVAIKYKKLFKNLEMDNFVSELLNEDNILIQNQGRIRRKNAPDLAWARTFLRTNNIIENKKKGYWTLTPQGEEIDSIYFDNKYYSNRFDSIDSILLERLRVYDKEKEVYDIRFSEKEYLNEASLINKSILIGENGAGKTSILRAINQIYLVLSKNQEINVKINTSDLDYSDYRLNYSIGKDNYYVKIIKENSQVKIICKKNKLKVPFSHLVFPKKLLAISNIVNDGFMFSSNDFYKYLGSRSSANGSFKGELEKNTILYYKNIIEVKRKKYLMKVINSLNISDIFLKENILFISRNEENFQFDFLSSGEKNYLNIFMAIISEADSSNVILIDEPESSLHPKWQMDFLTDLTKLCEQMGIMCHIIIATHSHFLISDLNPENSYLIHCYKENNNKITEFIKRNTYGWSAENVLYNIFGMRTTRNSYFLKDMSKLIKIVENQSTDFQELKNTITKLQKYTLSDDDPLNDVIKIGEDYYFDNKKD